MTQDIGNMIMTRNNIGNEMVTRGEQLRTLILFLMITLGTRTVWGQTDYSGTYYIANDAGYSSSVTTSNYYMVPAANPQKSDYNDAYYSADNYATKGDPEKPFITTYKTNRDNNSIWEITSTGDGYYYIKHHTTGKYLIYEPPYSDMTNRKSVHLQTTATPGANAKFDIAVSGTGVSIRPISLSSGNRFLNPAGSNKDFYYGNGGARNWEGLVGVWSANDGNSIWHLEATLAPPFIAISDAGNVTITSVAETVIHYTTDGTDPTEESATYSAAFPLAVGMTEIKAVAIRTADDVVSAVSSQDVNDYTYYIIDKQGHIAIRCTVNQAAGRTLNGYADIPSAISSPYIDNETVTFYSFSGDYASALLTAENSISETPTDVANIYITYTTSHLAERFFNLHGTRIFNITVGDEYIFDNSGTLSHETSDANKTTTNRLWYIAGEDPYAVTIQNVDTKRYFEYATPSTLTLGSNPTNKYFILMSGSALGDGSTYEQMELMAATSGSTYYRVGCSSNLNISTTATGDASLQVKALTTTLNTNYYLIDKAGKLIAGPLASTSSELALPDEWVSPLVSEYHYYKTSGLVGDTYSPSESITSPIEADDGNIYVTYDVSSSIDITGGKTYLLKFSGGETFNQEDGHDAILSTPTKAVYPYNNGDFNLYVYGQEQWESQLASGASTRTRWLWYIVSRHNGADLTGDDVDPYHVVIKSYQNQSLKIDETSYPGSSYLRTYKPEGQSSVVTGVAYQNPTYPNAKPSDAPTEYMILGTSLQNMTLKTINEVDGARRTVTSFEQYWKNNPTARDILNAADLGVGSQAVSYELSSAQQALLTAKGWYTYQAWANAAPWNDSSTGGKTLANGHHWFQTITMGTGQFTVEEVSLAPQVILLDQHGWEIVRVPLSDATTLRKYDSPMVEQYQWYPTAVKASGYHKYTVSNPEITVYKYALNSSGKYAWIDSGERYTHTSTSLSDSPYDHITTPPCEEATCSDASAHSTQPASVKTDFYVTYTVKAEYANYYRGAATAGETMAYPFLLKQGGNFATTDGSTITTTTEPANMDNAPNEMLWLLKPNFDIDREMGYKYAGEAGAQDGALSKVETDAANYDEGRNGFDPYNLQIQSKAYPLRYFTANTTASALSDGTWSGTSSSIAFQNMNTKQTATGYDQTTLNITNATFMVVDDGNGNMRLMPRFDHTKVMQSFTTLATQAAAASANDKGAATQSLYIVKIAREVHSTDEMDDMGGDYILASDFVFKSSLGTSESTAFTGTIDGQLYTLSGLTDPFVIYANGATIKNVILKNVDIDIVGNAGAIAANAKGTTRIYNCGILPTETIRDEENDVTGFSGSTIKGTGYTGSIVGYLDEYARVINCFSYANITGGSTVAGIVGYNTTATMQGNNLTNFNKNVKTMVMNCIFYGDITGGTSKYPVYGGEKIANNAADKVNNYNYYFEDGATFDASYTSLDNYNYSWPVAEKYLTRFEVYRNILNSNRRLCTWWVNGAYNTAPTDADVEKVDIAKWVLDRSIAPYPVLKKWGKYHSSFYIDPENVWNPKTNQMISRSSANAWEGRSEGTLRVTIVAGTNNSSAADVVRNITITDMDSLNYDFCAKKIQLPYYNEVFGNPDGATWAEKYGNNYTSKVVTGWKVTNVTGGTKGTFTANWESGYNFADRKCTDKDKFDVSGRVFAQGGYYYVPDDVTAITIEAYWGDAVYLCNSNRRLDRVNNAGADFYVAGQLSDKVNDITVKTSLGDAVNALSVKAEGNVYDQAIVLVGNYQQNNFHSNIHLSGNDYATGAKPFTIMSADFDFDNEPDFCFQAGMSGGGRENVQPIRFDFLMVPDLTMAVRTSNAYYGMRIFVPQGHFEITETSYIYTTQFEYDERADDAKYYKHEAPVILNGGEHLQIVSTENFSDVGDNNTATTQQVDCTSYFLMGGNVYMKAFTPGCHTKRKTSTRHCAVNAIGGEFPEFYLSGMFNAKFYNKTDNPHAYLDGGRFGIVAGAGMESVGGKDETNGGNVTFIINHSLIKEFYGGGINATRPVTGNISTTCYNSIIHKFCGGPKLGDMSNTKTITNTISNTVFDEYFGGGNGGTNMLRENQYDGWDIDAPAKGDTDLWDNKSKGKFSLFNPFTYVTNKGYHAEFEFELLPMPQGNIKTVPRTYLYYASFSKTTVAPITNTITDCTFNGNFYGGGNLGAVGGDVTSTLQGSTVVSGSVFGAGFSASIPSFQVHDKSTVVYPYRDYAGFIHDGSLEYSPIHYTWIHDVPTEWGITPSTSNPTFEYPAGSGTWYVYTTESLTGLGTVTGNVTLTLSGTTVAGSVYGGGDESATTGNTTVTIQDSSHITGNVFGGGNNGNVGGSTTVNVKN